MSTVYKINRACLEETASSKRRRMHDFITWQCVRASASLACVAPGDRITLYRVGRTNTFRLIFEPVARQAPFSRRATGGRFWIAKYLWRAVRVGDLVRLDGSTLVDGDGT